MLNQDTLIQVYMYSPTGCISLVKRVSYIKMVKIITVMLSVTKNKENYLKNENKVDISDSVREKDRKMGKCAFLKRLCIWQRVIIHQNTHKFIFLFGFDVLFNAVQVIS